MFDQSLGLNLVRCELEGKMLYSTDEFESQVAEALLEAYDRGEVEVERDLLTGELLFKLSQVQ
jgi:hypothetical protein